MLLVGDTITAKQAWKDGKPDANINPRVWH